MDPILVEDLFWHASAWVENDHSTVLHRNARSKLYWPTVTVTTRNCCPERVKEAKRINRVALHRARAPVYLGHAMPQGTRHFPTTALSQSPSNWTWPCSTTAPTRVASCVSGWPYPFLWWRLCPSPVHERSRLYCRTLSSLASLAALHGVDVVLVVDGKNKKLVKIAWYVKTLQSPEEVRELFDRQITEAASFDIFDIAAIRAFVSYFKNFLGTLPGSLWLHVFDNAAALSILIYGSSFVMQVIS